MSGDILSCSVIIPTHDRPAELVAALASLSAQTHTSFEAVVVNDGDADVDEIVHNSGLNVQLLQTEGHTGVSNARNMGMRAARGDVICFLDDDDIFHPDHLATHVAQYAASSEVMVVYSDAEQAVIEGDEMTLEVCFSQDFDADLLLVNNYIPTPSISFRRTCLDTVEPFDTTLDYLEDWEFFIRLSCRWNFVHVPKVTSRYFRRGYGTSLQEVHGMDFPTNLIKVYKEVDSLLSGQETRLVKIQAMRMQLLSRMVYDTGVFYEGQGDFAAAADNYARSVDYMPDPKGYLALARMQKKLGQMKEYVISMRLAERCRELQSEAEVG